MKFSIRISLILLAAGLLAACTPPDNSEQIAEIGRQQKEILAKLDAMEKKIEAAKAPPPRRQRPTGPDPDKKYDLPVAASSIKGPEDGSITIVEFSDYQCPFCARAEPIINDALKAYPTQARFVYKHFPLESIHPQAMGAAQAAVAAGMQGKFWEMHEKLFANQRALQREKLEQYAEEIGLDVDKFKADMGSDAVKNSIRDDMRLARTVGVRGTPTIFVNGKLLRNRSVDGFKQLIDELLEEGAAG
jgi:protein-disulfide isomerase